MKIQISIFLTSLLLLLSCKKDRTCTCTQAIISQTSTQPGYTYIPPPATTNTTTFKKISKNNINIQKCVSSESSDSYTYSTFNGTLSVKYEITTNRILDCELK